MNDSAKEEVDFSKYADLMRAAFDELHQTVLDRIATSGQSSFPHHYGHYTQTMDRNSGFPQFNQAGALSTDQPYDFGGAVHPRGLIALLLAGAEIEPPLNLPAAAGFREFIGKCDISKRFGEDSILRQFYIDNLIQGSVDKYFHLHGVGPIEKKKREIKFCYGQRGVLVGKPCRYHSCAR